MENNYVRMEQHMCPVCGVIHKHNTGILLHKNLKNIPEEDTITGWGMCEEHARMRDDGYVALIAVHSRDIDANKNITNLNYISDIRTGEIAHLKKDVFNNVFDVEPPEHGIVIIDEEVIQKLKEMQTQAE